MVRHIHLAIGGDDDVEARLGGADKARERGRFLIEAREHLRKMHGVLQPDSNPG